jgi:hypothetical protein
MSFKTTEDWEEGVEEAAYDDISSFDKWLEENKEKVDNLSSLGFSDEEVQEALRPEYTEFVRKRITEIQEFVNREDYKDIIIEMLANPFDGDRLFEEAKATALILDELEEPDEDRTKILLDRYANFFGKGGKVGCPYGGYLSVKEYEDNYIYIPKSYHCIPQILKKLYDVDVREDLDPFGITTRKARSQCKKYDIECPEFYRPDKRNCTLDGNTTFKISRNSHGKQIGKPKIFLVPTDKINYYHAVLVKSNADHKSIDYKYIMSRVQFYVDEELTIKEQRIHRSMQVDNTDCPVIMYDFETYVDDEKKKLKIKNKDGSFKELQIKVMHPIGVSYQRILPNMEKIGRFVGKNCHEDLLNHVFDMKEKKIYMYAYNAGKFDTLFFKRIKGVKFTKQIKCAGRVKSLTVEKEDNDTKIILRDLKDYFPGLHLGAALKAFKCKPKIEFDIIDKPYEWFMDEKNKEWIPYMDQDVDSISELFLKANEYIKRFGYDIRDNVTISGMSWKLLMKNSYNMRTINIPNHISLSLFIRNAIYGGRTMSYKRVFKDGEMISLDANSLYPSAMNKYWYPAGNIKLIKNRKEFLELLGGKKGKDGKGYNRKLLIAEVTVIVPNNKMILFPYRTKEKGGKLIYRCGKIQGVYTSVELLDLYKDGGKIVKFHRGVYWTKKCKYFKGFTNYLYDERNKLKKEGNSFEHVIKIVLNSLYGKHQQKIDKTTSFSNSPTHKRTKYFGNTRSKKLANGQYELTTNYENFKETKPYHISAFILSYSRHIMNNIIRKIGSENIYYGDTDSIYVNVNCLDKIPEFLKNGLGYFKNDYGDKYIDEALFVGIKRYLVRFNDGSFKAKFNGINFAFKGKGSEDKNKTILMNYFASSDKNLYSTFRKFYEDLLDEKNISKAVFQKRWRRTNIGCYVYTDKFYYNCGMEGRGKYVNNIFIPIGYDENKPIVPLFKGDFNLDEYYGKGKDLIKNDFVVNQHGLFSAHPLLAEKENTVRKVDTIRTSFIKKGDEIMYRNKRKNYLINKYGNTGKEGPDGEYEMVITLSKDQKEKYPLSELLPDKLCKYLVSYIKLSMLYKSGVIKDKSELAEIKKLMSDYLANIHN